MCWVLSEYVAQKGWMDWLSAGWMSMICWHLAERVLQPIKSKAPRKQLGSFWGSLPPLLFRITLITICESSKEPEWACGKLEGCFLLLAFTESLLKGPHTPIWWQDPVVRVSMKENEPIRLAKIKLLGCIQYWQGCRETGSLHVLVGMEVGRAFLLEGFGGSDEGFVTWQ